MSKQHLSLLYNKLRTAKRQRSYAESDLAYEKWNEQVLALEEQIKQLKQENNLCSASGRLTKLAKQRTHFVLYKAGADDATANIFGAPR